MGSKDVLRSRNGTVSLCSIPTPMDPDRKRDLEGKKNGYTASESRSPPR